MKPNKTAAADYASIYFCHPKNGRLTRTHKTGSRSDGDKTRNSSRAETNSRPLALKTVIPEHPSQTANAGSKVGDNACLGCAQVRGEGRATIEAEPAEPEEGRAQNNVGRIVRLVGEACGIISTTLAEVKCDSKCGSAGGDVHWGTASEVKATKNVRPSMGIPCPIGDRVVDERRPNENEESERT